MGNYCTGTGAITRKNGTTVRLTSKAPDEVKRVDIAELDNDGTDNIGGRVLTVRTKNHP